MPLKRFLKDSRNLARFIQKSVEERTLDPGTFVRKRIFTAHDSGHLADHDCRFIKTGRICKRDRSTERFHIHGNRRAIKGCAPVPDSIIHDLIDSHRFHKREMAANIRIITLKNTDIPCLPVEVPRKPRKDECPVRAVAPVVAPPCRGANTRECAVDPLARTQIIQPLQQKACTIKVQHHLFKRVSNVADPRVFLPVRIICR